MEDVIKILLKDSELLKLTDNNIKPFGDLKIGKGLTYNFAEISNNGIKSVYRLTVTSVSYSITDSLKISNRVNKLLITIGDDRLNDNVLKVAKNGGGSSTNTIDGKNMYHFTNIYNITRRED